LPSPIRPGRQAHLPTYLRHESISSTRSRIPRPTASPAAGHASRSMRHSPRPCIQRAARPSCSRARCTIRAPTSATGNAGDSHRPD
jgi:hypothetical protein